VRAYFRAGGIEHALDRPIVALVSCIADHLNGRARTIYDRLAVLDRERTPGEHEIDRLELLELVTSAHALLADPPTAVRKLRRLPVGPHPAAAPIGELSVWLRARVEACVVYDLWRSSATLDA